MFRPKVTQCRHSKQSSDFSTYEALPSIPDSILAQLTSLSVTSDWGHSLINVLERVRDARRIYIAAKINVPAEYTDETQCLPER